jgi:hypothetical protein
MDPEDLRRMNQRLVPAHPAAVEPGGLGRRCQPGAHHDRVRAHVQPTGGLPVVHAKTG